MSTTNTAPYLRAGTTVYTLHQVGWRKGVPVMVNEITIQVSVDPKNGLDAETVAGWVQDAMNAREAALTSIPETVAEHPNANAVDGSSPQGIAP